MYPGNATWNSLERNAEKSYNGMMSFESANEEERPEVPQVRETGVSHDYYNVFMPFVGHWIVDGGDFHEQVRQHLHYLPLYRERYKTYTDVVTEKNRARLAQLDAIIHVINQQVQEGTLTEERFCALHNRAVDLIYGEKGGTYLHPGGGVEERKEQRE